MDGDDDDREQRLRNRAYALTDLSATRQRIYLQCIELVSSGGVVIEATSRVRRHVVVHRDLRDAMRQCILRNGWDFAVTRIPPGAKSDEFARLSGWSWYGPRRYRVVPGNTLNSLAREIRTLKSTIRDRSMLKGKHEFKGQDRRRATLTGARLIEAIIELAVAADDAPNKIRVRAYTLAPNFGLEPSGATWKPDDIESPQLAGQSWGAVCEHPDDIAAQDECDAIALAQLDGVVTDKERIAGLNARHRALLETFVGKSTYVPPPTMNHPAADMGCQTAALDMVFTEEVGLSIRARRDRHNNLLEHTEKFNKYGKRYRPGKAAPGRRLTGNELIRAIADLRPEKQGWPHTKPYPRGDEIGLFERCQRMGRKELQDYAIVIRTDDVEPDPQGAATRALRKEIDPARRAMPRQPKATWGKARIALRSGHCECSRPGLHWHCVCLPPAPRRKLARIVEVGDGRVTYTAFPSLISEEYRWLQSLNRGETKGLGLIVTRL